MTGELGWQSGDFDGNRQVDGNDLNEMGLNWQHGVVAMQPVPEPTGRAWMLVCCAMLRSRLRLAVKRRVRR